MSKASVRFKHPQFESEHEWRIVNYLDKSQHNRVSFRESNGLLVPYIELPVLKPTHGDTLGKFWPLKTVRFGPTSHPELARQSIEMFVKQRTYEDVRIVGSSIPLVVSQ